MVTKKQKEKRNDKEAKGCSVCFMVSALIGAIITGGKVMLGMGIGLLCCIIYFLALYLVRSPERKKEKMIKFYEECVAAGIKDLRAIKNHKRAELIAEKLELKGIDVEKYYNKGKEYKNELADDIKKEQENEILDELRKEEKNKYDILTKYANLQGNSKTIAILTEQLKEVADRLSALSNFEQNASDLMLEKEKDWAIHGGIASGLAGGAAGVATALNIQAENAEIRSRNDEKKKMISAAAPYMKSRAKNASSSYYSILSKIEKEKIKLIGEITSKDVLSHLTFTSQEITVSKTGTITVKVIARMNKKMTIYDDVPAKVDGTVVAKIMNNNKEVGNAFMVLPLYGVSYPNEVELTGMILNAGTQETDYDVSFTATNLYAIEC